MLHQIEQDLIAKGYRKYTSPHNSADYFYQKRIRSSDGKTKYFLNVSVYDFKKYFNQGFRFHAEATMYQEDESFEVRRSVESVQHTEQFFEDVYSRMRCTPDWLNND